MLLSLILPFRNRDKERIRHCLNSLAGQSFKDFELIFADYGSDPKCASLAEALCADYDFVNYLYSHSKGLLWNRACAINTGLREARGDYIMTVDADLVYPPNFLQGLSERLAPNTLCHYRCYWVSEGFRDYENVFAHRSAEWPASTQSGKGLFAVARKKIQSIGGFDEFYRVWGMEDMDLHRRLDRSESRIVWLPLKAFPVFHQWHPKSDVKENMPKGWKQMMIDYYHAKTDSDIIAQKDFGHLIAENERPALALSRNPEKCLNYTFERPTENSFADFSRLFHELPSGKAIRVEQHFELLKVSESSRLGKWVERLNKRLGKTRLSYRVVDLSSYESEVLSFYAVRDFLFYFLHNHGGYLQDYFFEYQNPSLEFVAVKA